MGGFREKRGGATLPREHRKPRGVVGMFVGNQDAVDAFGTRAQGFQAPQRFAFSQSRVNQETGSLGFEQRSVARASGSQDGNSKTDARSSGPAGPGEIKTRWMMANWRDGVNRVSRFRGAKSQGRSQDQQARCSGVTAKPLSVPRAVAAMLSGWKNSTAIR